jgi:hypothetical protein
LRGFVHAHVGWLFRHDQRGSRARYATDLLADPVIRFVDRTFVLWALGGLALAFGLGVVIGGSLTAGLTGLLQGMRARRQSDPARPLRTNSKCRVSAIGLGSRSCFATTRQQAARSLRSIHCCGERAACRSRPIERASARGLRERRASASSLSVGHPVCLTYGR